MKEGSQPRLKSPDDSAVETHSKRLCAEMDSFKKFSVQMAKVTDPLRKFRLSVAGIARATDSFKVLSSPVMDVARATDSFKVRSSPMMDVARATDSLRGFNSQIAGIARAANSLKVRSSPVMDVARAADSFKVRSSPMIDVARATDFLKVLSPPAVQINRSVVDFNHILNEVIKSTAPLISTSVETVDVFIEPKHPEIVEQPGIIPCPADPDRSFGKKVFIVCGRDEGTKQTVARWIEKLGLEAIVIDEQPSGARTGIEKFERYTNDVDFTVVLLTPDDVGKPKDKLGKPNFRASQNVILQVGVLIGKYGRDRICFLCTEELELPSDINGITPVTMDTNGGWILNLIREMESVGLPVDLHKAI